MKALYLIPLIPVLMILIPVFLIAAIKFRSLQKADKWMQYNFTNS